jgi:D-glycero-D-manno-heptose 1,7-bisphosphate phosphatase
VLIKKKQVERAVIFDRDGVINDVVMRGETISSPRSLAEFQVRDDFVQLYEQIDPQYFSIFVVSNQPDVARGLLPKSELDLMSAAILERFAFSRISYCEHDDSAACECRKPKPGMILSILEDFGCKPENSLIVGDGWKDVLAGKAAGVRTVYLCREYNEKDMNCQPDSKIDRLVQLLPIMKDML